MIVLDTHRNQERTRLHSVLLPTISKDAIRQDDADAPAPECDNEDESAMLVPDGADSDRGTCVSLNSVCSIRASQCTPTSIQYHRQQLRPVNSMFVTPLADGKFSNDDGDSVPAPSQQPQEDTSQQYITLWTVLFMVVFASAFLLLLYFLIKASQVPPRPSVCVRARARVCVCCACLYCIFVSAYLPACCAVSACVCSV